MKKLTVTEDGYFLDISAKNKLGESVYPYIKGKLNTANRGFDITLTGNKADYFLVSLEKLFEHIRAGDFDQKGRVRMKPRTGGVGNGFAVRKAVFSEALIDAIAS